MQAVAHNPAFAKKAGVPQSVGKEFTKSGGGMATKMNAGFMAMMKKKAGDKPMKKMASGGMTSMGKVKTGSGRDGVAERGKTKGTMIKMNKGGRAC